MMDDGPGQTPDDPRVYMYTYILYISIYTWQVAQTI